MHRLWLASSMLGCIENHLIQSLYVEPAWLRTHRICPTETNRITLTFYAFLMSLTILRACACRILDGTSVVGGATVVVGDWAVIAYIFYSYHLGAQGQRERLAGYGTAKQEPVASQICAECNQPGTNQADKKCTSQSGHLPMSTTAAGRSVEKACLQE